MRYSKLILLVAFVAFFQQRAQSQAITNGLVAYWNFENGSAANDESGNGHHGTISGNPVFEASMDDGELALRLDGNGDQIDIPYSSGLNPQIFSLSIWFKPERDNLIEALFSGYNTGITAYLTVESTFGGFFDGIRMNWENPNATWHGTEVNQPTPINQWTHLVVTYDGIQGTYYINNVNVGSFNMASPANTAHSLIIGNIPGGSRPFLGTIDDIYFFNRAISSTEVNTLYSENDPGEQTTNPPSTSTLCQEIDCTGLVAAWEFESGDFSDGSGNGNVGLMQGGVQETESIDPGEKAMYFDGVDDYAEIPYRVGLNPTTFTLSMWVYPERTDIRQSMWVGYGDGNPAYLSFESSVPDGFSNGINANWENPNQTWHAFTQVDPLESQTWYHLTVTYDGSLMSYYRDGQFISSQSFNGPITGGQNIRIGGWGPGNYYHQFQGKLDDIFFYNRAISQSEITALYERNGLTIPPSEGSSCSSIFCDGDDVGIGVETVPEGFKLAVGGKIITESVKVALQANWPDYVFNEDYALVPLKELEAFIKTHGHLPEVPEAKKVEKEGYFLEQMLSIQLKKIEELTLYLIDQNKKNIQQQNEIEQLKKELASIKKPDN